MTRRIDANEKAIGSLLIRAFSIIDDTLIVNFDVVLSIWWSHITEFLAATLDLQDCLWFFQSNYISISGGGDGGGGSIVVVVMMMTVVVIVVRR